MPALLAALRTLGVGAIERIAVSLEGLGATAVGRNASGVYAAIRRLIARNPKTARFIVESLALVGIQIGVEELMGSDAEDEEVRKEGQPVAQLTLPNRQRILTAMREYGTTLGRAVALHSGDGNPNTVDGLPADQELAKGIEVLAKVRLLREAKQRTGMTWRELEYLRLLLAAEPQWFSLAMTSDELG